MNEVPLHQFISWRCASHMRSRPPPPDTTVGLFKGTSFIRNTLLLELYCRTMIPRVLKSFLGAG